MKDYFNLQIVRINRRFKETGLHPFIGYLLGLTAFVLLAEFIFQKTTLAKYLFILAGISLQFQLSEKNRTDFIRTIFGDRAKIKIRVLENLILSTPFIVVLLFKNFIIEACILFFSSIILALISFHARFNFTLPTPFSRRPFEFATGFRKTFFIFPLAYILTIIAISVNNLNLGIFALLSVFLTVLSYYNKPEQEYLVWVFADSPQSFLKKKILLATKNAFLLTLPVTIGLLIFYPTEYARILIFLLIGILYLWTMILGKYAAFPSEINLTEGIILALGITLPPLILLIIPYFYIKSIKNLSLLLHD